MPAEIVAGRMGGAEAITPLFAIYEKNGRVPLSAGEPASCPISPTGLLLRALRIIQRKAACKQAAFPAGDFPSEPEMGPEGDAQIVPGTIIEVNLVAYVQSQSDRAQEPFDTSAWIECKLGVAAGHPTQS